MDTIVDIAGLPLAVEAASTARVAADDLAKAAAAFAYRLALYERQSERDAEAAAQSAYLFAGGEPTLAQTVVSEIVAAESRTRHLWLRRPLHPMIARTPLPSGESAIHQSM